MHLSLISGAWAHARFSARALPDSVTHCDARSAACEYVAAAGGNS
jgi:hypothetical protein